MADPSTSNISIPITSEPMPIVTVDDSIDGVEQDAPGIIDDGIEANGTETINANAEADLDAPAELEEMQVAEVRRQTFVDYLRSPIVTIVVGEENPTNLSAHLALLQSSPYLARVCATYTSEMPLHERTIHLPDEDMAAVGSLLEYLYTGEYAPRLVPGSSANQGMVLEEIPDAPEADDSGEHLLRHARVYTLGEKLELPKLKELAHSKIHRINSSAKGELRYAKFVYKHTSRDDKVIRAPIATFWAHRSHVLRHEAEEEFRHMILEFPLFAYDILNIVLDAKEKNRDKRGGAASITNNDTDVPSTPVEKVPRTGRKRPRTSTAM